MIRYILATSVLLLYFYLLWNSATDPERDLSKGDKIANAVTHQFSRKAKEKYQLRLAGIGGGATKDKMHTLTVHFYLYRPVLKDEARQLIVTACQGFLEDINGSEQLRPYLQDVPFTVNNIDVAIFFTDKDRYDVFHPYLDVVSCVKGKVTYNTMGPEDEFKYFSKEHETYDEAVAILQSQPKL